METVTLSWSVKNFITVNLMVIAGGAVIVLAAQAVKSAKARKGQS